MGVYERYCKWPSWLRWILFLPVSFIGATTVAWFFRFLHTYELLQIAVDLGYPVLWQFCFLSLVFFTVPKKKIGWIKFFFILRTIFSTGYIIFGVVGLHFGIEASSKWEYWKAGIAEMIVFFVSFWLMSQLKDEILLYIPQSEAVIAQKN